MKKDKKIKWQQKIKKTNVAIFFALQKQLQIFITLNFTLLVEKPVINLGKEKILNFEVFSKYKGEKYYFVLFIHKYLSKCLMYLKYEKKNNFKFKNIMKYNIDIWQM